MPPSHGADRGWPDRTRALGGGELAEGGADGAAQRVRRAGDGGAEQALELAEGEFSTSAPFQNGL